jgi:hypothetical protein
MPVTQHCCKCVTMNTLRWNASHKWQGIPGQWHARQGQLHKVLVGSVEWPADVHIQTPAQRPSTNSSQGIRGAVAVRHWLGLPRQSSLYYHVLISNCRWPHHSRTVGPPCPSCAARSAHTWDICTEQIEGWCAEVPACAASTKLFLQFNLTIRCEESTAFSSAPSCQQLLCLMARS